MLDILKKAIAVNLGRTSYREAWDLQKIVFNLRASSKISDVLILNEHDHVYTIGKSGGEDHLLASNCELMDNNVELHRIDRGGDITYHGPGQLVGYPIIDLNNHRPDIHRYLRDLEEVIILSLRYYGIDAYRDKEFTGVWVGKEKIAAIGIKVSRWITMHGFALNVATDMSYFNRIIPCGIFHRGITSMEKILNRYVPMDDIACKIISNFSEVFDRVIEYRTGEEFIQYVKNLMSEKVEYI